MPYQRPGNAAIGLLVWYLRLVFCAMLHPSQAKLSSLQGRHLLATSQIQQHDTYALGPVVNL
jgi:hypothetical protein